MHVTTINNVLPCSDLPSQNTQRRGWIVHCYLIFLSLIPLILFVTGVAAGLLIGKAIFEEAGGQPSAYWGLRVTQGGVEKPVLEAIVDKMNAKNI